MDQISRHRCPECKGILALETHQNEPRLYCLLCGWDNWRHRQPPPEPEQQHEPFHWDRMDRVARKELDYIANMTPEEIDDYCREEYLYPEEELLPPVPRKKTSGTAAEPDQRPKQLPLL